MAQKKHSARRGGRVMKGDVTPVNASRRDEIVEAIVDNLRPWNDHYSRDSVTAGVNNDIDVLLNVLPGQKKLFDRKPYRKYGKMLDEALGKVEKLLSLSPETLTWELFNPLLPFRPVDKSAEEIDREYRRRFDVFVTELRRLREICTRRYGFHPNYDHAKHLSAEFAFGFMRHVSDKEITGTEDGAFRTIASLLYEIVTGQPDVDLKRACDAVLAFTKPHVPRQTSD